MSGSSRLSLALDSGALALPAEGRIALFAPRAGVNDADLAALARPRCHVITGFRPDRDHFENLGYACADAPEGRYGAAVVFLARARALSEALIASACAVSDGPVVVDGAKSDGIETLLRACRRRAEVAPPLSKGHGKLFHFPAGPGFADWQAGPPRQIAGGFVTAPGIFSADGIDPGSALLADHLPARLGAQVADLGAGWGYLAARVLARARGARDGDMPQMPDGPEGPEGPETRGTPDFADRRDRPRRRDKPGPRGAEIAQIHLVEADRVALDCARRNLSDPRACFHWQDATRWQPEQPLDTVITNPPFHAGRRPDPGLGLAFIAAAARILAPRGQLFLVANRHLPYEAQLQRLFREVTEFGGDQRFKLLHAARPVRPGA
ncbi:MAG: class I SAM-dependent methyltransferase [Roseovarius sp.]